MNKINSSLIIYHAGHYGFLSKYLIQKMKEHDDDHVIILVDCTFASPETKAFLSEWDEDNGSGCKVVTYADSSFWKCSTVAEVREAVVDYFNDVFFSLNIDVKDADCIYSGYDGLNAFAAFLCIQNIKYVAFDVLGNTLNYNQAESLYDNNLVKYTDGAQPYLDFLKEYDVLSAKSEYVSSILFTDSRMISKDKNWSYFDYISSIGKLTNVNKKRLRKVYNLDKNSLSGGTLVLLRSYAAVKYFGADYDSNIKSHQRLLWTYRMIIDCYYNIDDTIILKAHPNYSIPADVRGTFPNSVYIGGHVPFDLLEAMGLQPSSVLSIGGSSPSFSTVKNTVIFPESLFSASSKIFMMYSSYIISKAVFNDNCRIEIIDKGDKFRFSSFFVILSKNDNIMDNGKNTIIIDQKKTSMWQLENLIKTMNKESIVIIHNPDINVRFWGSFVTYFRITKEKREEFNEQVMGSVSDEFIAVLYTNPKYQLILDNIQHRRVMSRSSLNLIVEPVVSWQDNPSICYEEMFDIFYKCAIAGDTISMASLGRAYRDGKGVDVNLYEAAKWMRKIANKDIEWAKNDLFDILWRLGTESHKEMVDIATSFSKKGDLNAMGRLGRAYRDGKGVDKNLDKSAECFRKVADKYPNWVAEATDVMLKTTNSDNWSYAFRRCSEIASNPSTKIDSLVRAGVMGRLSYMYRDGKGVEKNLDKAIEWMRKAVDYNSKWTSELDEVLLLKQENRKTNQI